MNVFSRLHQHKLPAKKRDWWEKSTGDYLAVSSVVLAGTGLYISSSFQRTQNSITQQNNAAQLELAKQKNAADLRLQELKTATDLMEPLLSADKRKRQIALIMLPHTVSDGVMSRQILLIATQDQVSDVLTALHQMGQSTQASVAAQLQKLSKEPSRPAAGREVASTEPSRYHSGRSSDEFDCVFRVYAGAKGYDSPELGGGIFTSALSKALTQQSLG